MVKVGLVTGPPTPSARAAPRTKVVLPLPSSPLTSTRSPGRSRSARRAPVLDLRTLKCVDSTGLRLILAAHARALKRGGRLTIVQGSDAVRRIFGLTGVGERLNIFDDLQAAEATV